jgi:hypothetical protein
VAALSLSVVALGTVLTTGSAAAAPHLAAGPEAYNFDAYQTMTSSTHHKVVVDIQAAYNTSATPDTTQFNITLATRQDAERHEWILAVPNKVFTRDSHGGGTLMLSQARIAPYGVVRMTYTPLGAPKTQTCGTTSYVQRQRVRLTGRFYFNTKSTGKQRWGTVGSKRDATTFRKTAELDTGFGQTNTFCETPPRPTPCTSALGWSARNAAGTVSLGGESENKGQSFAEASRYVSLAKPAGAVRSDELFTNAPPPTLSHGMGGAATMSVTSKGSWLTGSAKFRGPTNIMSIPEACGNGGTRTDQLWDATVANGKVPLEFNLQIFGKIKLRANMTVGVQTDS